VYREFCVSLKNIYFKFFISVTTLLKSVKENPHVQRLIIFFTFCLCNTHVLGFWNIQGVSGGIVNILGGGSMEYSE